MHADTTHIRACRNAWHAHTQHCRQCLATLIGFAGYPKCEIGAVLYDEYRHAISACHELEVLTLEGSP